MFESAEVGHTIGKSVYRREEPKLRERLLEAQYKLLKEARTTVLIVIGGVDGAGKGETVNLLNEWMDPRHIRTFAFGVPSDEEAERPPMWRFWRSLPGRGRIGILFGSWYSEPIVNRVYRRMDEGDFQRSLDRIRHFERMLSDEGVLLLKVWFHLSRKDQKRRLEALEGDAATRWRVTKFDWERYEHYNRFAKVSAHALRDTSTAGAAWTVVEGTDARYRSLTVGKLVLEALRKRVGAKGSTRARGDAPPQTMVDNLKLLRSLDLTQTLDKKDYEKKLSREQGLLNGMVRKRRFAKRSLILVFEGVDAAGKGGAIRRITRALDARQYSIIPVAAPTEDERAHPYLWRFWRHVPRHGRVAVFDRSWYGRVLVERVEGFCAEGDWVRAYGEINEFEQQLVESGAILCKFWLQISREEQLRRFKERENTPFKRFKIGEEDWRNRKKWPQYERAVADMVDRTSTETAPWTLIEAEDKQFARVKVLKTVVDRLEEAL